MSLSYDDLQGIRKIVEETVNPIKGDLEALGNDIKEIYDMITNLQNTTSSGKSFEKLNLERIVGRAMPQNKASVRVLEKCGMDYH